MTGLDLPTAVAGVLESSQVLRVGVVSAIVAADNITVKISGSNVLVRASYQFPAYSPLIGDRVVVTKQDAQWYVIGPMSGPINSLLVNSSFEDGPFNGTPTGWTIQVISSAGGVPTFTKVSGGVRGIYMADFGVDNPGAANFSEANVFSSTVVASPGSRWTAAFYLVTVFQPADPVRFSDLTLAIQFLDAGGTVLLDVPINESSFAVDVYNLIYYRLRLTVAPSGYVEAPAGTAGARMRIGAFFDLPATNFISFFIDDAILRDVTAATS